MEIIAKFESGTFNVYKNYPSQIAGKIHIESSANFNKSEIIIQDKVYKVIRDKWETTITYGDEILFHLATNSFSGNTEIKELDKKIKGVWGLKWNTQLTDKDGSTLLKIRNEKKSVNNGNYIIELADQGLSSMEILISLYGHLYGSSIKQHAALTGILAGG
jgi:hypothetical protein